MTLVNVFELVLKMTLTTTSGGAKPCWNVFHYVASGAGALPTPNQILEQFRTVVWPNWAALLSVDLVGVSLSGRYLDDATVQFFVDLTAPASGAVALPRLPSESAVVTPYQCTQRGKNYRGSKHFAGVPTASVVKDELAPGVVAAFTAAANALAAPITGAGLQSMIPIVLSRSKSQLKVNPTHIDGSTVSGVLLNKTIGGMRKRKEKTAR
jgi:hypothetical protein